MVRSLVVVVACSSPGCMIEAELWPPDTGKGADLVELREYACPQFQCDMVLNYNMSDLEDCYGWDPLWGWIGAPPSDIMNDCVPGTADCSFSVRSELTEAWNVQACEHCSEGAYEDPIPEECCFAEVALEASLADLWEDQGVDVALQVEADCGIQPVVAMECVHLDGGHDLQDPCPTDALRETPDANYLLEVDGASSFATVQSVGGSVAVHLSGTAVVASRPAEVLVTVVDAEGAVTMGDKAITDLRFWFSNDIALDLTSGRFSVPRAVPMSGRGKLNGGWFEILLEPTATATGTFGAERWELDYDSTFAGGSVRVHLEGPLHATSSP